ncbi:MAG: TetR/AcrR family transcriptional regulator [bacterium]
MVIKKNAIRRNRRGEQTRQQITDVLIRMLAQKNIWDIKITDITRELGITSQSFYMHYKTIEDVLAAHKEVVLGDVPDYHELFAGEWTDEDSYHQLRAIVEETLAYWDKHRVSLRVMTILNDVDNPQFRHFRRDRGKPVAMEFAKKIENAFSSGRLSGSLDAEVSGWSMVARLTIFGDMAPYMMSMGHDKEALIDTITKTLQISLGFKLPSSDGAK